MKTRDIIKLTSVPVVIASLCCLSPVILVLFGIGTVGFASSLADTLYGDYKWVFRGAGLLAMIVSLVLYFRRTKGICTIDDVVRKRNEVINIIALTVTACVIGYLFFLYIVVHYIGVGLNIWGDAPQNMKENITQVEVNAERASVLFGGGCFWCVEADLEKLYGVGEVVSGYAGGTTENPTYENYAAGGHREVVEASYDPAKITYKELALFLLTHVDASDAGGSFGDRGPQYAPALYYADETEKLLAEEAVKEIETKKIYDKPLAIKILPRQEFFPAEEYHQEYYKKNPVRYAYYRKASGRDEFAKSHSELTPLQYKVIKEEGTEPPFQNEYHDNKKEGLYVDRISGEPLFSSKDKYDSGTGWPSFVQPLSLEVVTLHEDKKLFSTRTEVRSLKADSHLGHVFDDGPQDRGGKRYCLNSAALRFVPKEDMEKEGYGEFLDQI